MVEKEKESYWREPLVAFGRMSGLVVGPILLALIVGKWLDDKYNTAPFIFLGCTALAFIVSISGLVRESKKYLNTIKKNETKNEKNNESDSNTNNSAN